MCPLNRIQYLATIVTPQTPIVDQLINKLLVTCREKSGAAKGLKKNEGLVVGTVGVLLSNSGAKSDTFLAQLHSKLLY